MRQNHLVGVDGKNMNTDTKIALLQNELHSLIGLINGNDYDNNDSEHDYDHDDVTKKLQSISTALKKCHDKNENNSDTNDDDMIDRGASNFIRTNLNNYNKSIPSASSTSASVINSDCMSLRTILESKSCITRLLHSLTQIMTTAINATADEEDNTNESGYENENHFVPAIQLMNNRINACQIYLSLCLLCPDSWSTGWIDVVSMRYVETLMRKWSSFCCQLKSLLLDDDDDDDIAVDHKCKDNDDDCDNSYDGGRSRLKRTRLNNDQKQKQRSRRDCNEKSSHSNRRISNNSCSGYRSKDKSLYWKVIKNGIELSTTMSHILLKLERTNFWNWNIEARDAFLDGITLGLSTCSALCANNYLTCVDAGHYDDDNDTLGLGLGLTLEQFCIDTVQGVSNALKFSLSSSLESSFQHRHNGNDGIIDNHSEDDTPGEDFQSPNHGANGSNIHHDATTRSRATAITILRNIHPLLTYQIELPNGVRGKQAAFDECQMMISGMVESLSLKLKASSHKTVTTLTPHGAIGSNGHVTKSKMDESMNSNTMTTPLTRRRRGPQGQRSSPSITPKSTNKRKSLQTKKGLNLAIPPSLKKSVTPRRFSHRKSHLLPSSKSSSRSSKAITYEIRAKEVLDIFLALMQRLSTGRNMERVEVRTRISSLLKCILEKMNGTFKAGFVSFLIRLCSSKISSHRIFGVELLSSFLVMEWIWDNKYYHFGRAEENYGCRELGILTTQKTNGSLVEGRGEEILSPEFPPNQTISFLSAGGKDTTRRTDNGCHNLSREILVTLLERVTDHSPAVRARVTIALSSAFKEIQIFVRKSDDIQKLSAEVIDQIRPKLVASLRQRATSDEKATVRKGSILALTDILLLGLGHDQKTDKSTCPSPTVTAQDILVLSQLCNDSSVAVRKTAIDSIMSLLQSQHHHSDCELTYDLGLLEMAWVNNVLPLVRDVEPSCVSKIVDSFEYLIVAPLVEVSEDKNTLLMDSFLTARYYSTWNILSTLNHGSSSTPCASKGTKTFLKFVLRKFFEGKHTYQRKKLCTCILRHLHVVITNQAPEYGRNIDEKFVGAWCLLETMGALHTIVSTGQLINLKDSFRSSGIDTEFLVSTCFNLLAECNCDSTHASSRASTIVSAKSCLYVISSFAPLMTREEMQSLAVKLKESTKSFQLSLDLIGASTSALVSLATALCDDKSQSKVTSTCADWIKEIYYKCEANLNIYVSSETSVDIDDSKLSRVIFTAGEMCMVGFQPDVSNYGEKKKKRNEKSSPMERLSVHPSNRLVRLIQLLLPLTLPSVDDLPGKEVNHVLRAHAFITFGKMCLRDEALAKESLSIFVQEIYQTGPKSNEAVRSNALLVLGDLCICYTHLVDKFIPLMASCLQPQVECRDRESAPSIVQQHALLLFSNLILQDYIKWKGALFFRFLTATVESDMAKALLSGPLLGKQVNLFSSNFVNALFILNGCASHPIHKARRITRASDIDVEKTGFLKIDEPQKRFQIYGFLLDHLKDEEKIAVTARLAKEVLKSATESTGYLSQAASAHGGVQKEENNLRYGAYCVLSDCLSILIDSRLLVGKSKQVDLPDDEDTNTSTLSLGPSAAQISSMKGKLLSKINRKHLIESMIPILCNLKIILEKSRSPLLKDLMRYMVCIFRQFKNEVNEVLESDSTLMHEIQYDTKQFEKSQNLEVGGEG